MKTFKEYLEEAHRPGHVAIAVNGNYPGVKKYTVFFRPDAKSPLGRTKAKDISHHDDLADAKKAMAEYVEKHKNYSVVALRGLNEESIKLDEVKLSPEYYEKLASYHDADANLKYVNKNIIDHAKNMSKRAKEAAEMIRNGHSPEKAYKHYQGTE